MNSYITVRTSSLEQTNDENNERIMFVLEGWESFSNVESKII